MMTFASKIVIIVFGLIASIVTARILGPEGKGYYSLLMLVPALLIQFGNLGIGTANTYFGGSKKYSFSTLASNSVVVAIGLGVAIPSFFLMYYYIFKPSFLSELKAEDIIVTCLIIPFSLISAYFGAIILGQMRIKQANLIALSNSVLSSLLTIFVLLFTKAGLMGLIVIWIFNEITIAAVSFIVVRQTQKFKILSFNPDVFWATLKFGVVGYTGNIIQFFNYRLDMLMIASSMSILYVGYYSIAVSLVETLWYLPASIGMVIFASTPGTNLKVSNKTTPVICRNTLFLTLITSVVLFILSKFLITLLFGQEYLPAVEPLWILLPGVVALSVCKVLCNEITGRGKPRINLMASAISLAVNIPMNAILIPRMGMAGAAIATSVSYTITSVFVLIVFGKLTGNKIIDIILIKKSDFKLYLSTASIMLTFMHKKKAIAE